MAELKITVSVPGEPPRTYLFGDTPVLIGRSPKCRLSICHEAVGRELCKAWIEGDGRTVRVEECPGLTNPLTMGSKPVRGGLVGKHLNLNVGPLSLSFRPSSSKDNDGASTPTNSRAPRRIVHALVVVAILGMGAVFAFWPRAPLEVRSDIDLPDSVPLNPHKSKPGQVPEPAQQAAILYSRAVELLSRTGAGPREKAIAAGLMIESVDLLKLDGDSIETSRRQREAEDLKRALNLSYRKEVIALHRHLEKNNMNAASAIASTLLEYLGASDGNAVEWLEQLASCAPTGEDSK